MLRKVVYAGSQSASFVRATKDLEALSEIKVTRERVQRWTNRVGNERTAEVDASSTSYQSLTIPEQWASPTAHVPRVACVMVDGGRIQIRDRHAKPKANESKGHWRESLVGCLLRNQGVSWS